MANIMADENFTANFMADSNIYGKWEFKESLARDKSVGDLGSDDEYDQQEDESYKKCNSIIP